MFVTKTLATVVRKLIFSAGFILLLISCNTNSSQKLDIAFYHWKANAQFSDKISTTLSDTHAKTIYMHYFDVDDIKPKSNIDDGLYPVYVITKIDDAYIKYPIIPVVFITNEALKKASINLLAERIHSLVDEISKHHLKRITPEIQLDCDWTVSTKEKYFELIKQLNTFYEVSATIRLHQIKYKEQTGVPPATKGVLMLYNMGKLDDDHNNSILEPSIVSDYINEDSEYPLKLSLALPLFSQTVIKNNANEIKLINGVDHDAFTPENTHFKKIDEHLYEVVKDTLYHSFYLDKGYRLKVEEISEPDVIAASKIVQNSKLDLSEIIFYHLDDKTLDAVDPTKIINQL